jgi:hypothetical protein
MNGPWVKLWRTFLSDPTVQYLKKRHGDVTVTVLIALLTATCDGIVVTPEDELAALCDLDDDAWVKIINFIIERGIILRDDNQRISFRNWNKYQEGKSTERTRKYRERTVTARHSDGRSDQNVTGRSKILEVEVEEEKKSPLEEGEATSIPYSILSSWYKRHAAATARLVAPSDPDRLAGKDLRERYPESELERAVAEYWDNWPDYWFAVKQGDSKKPRDERRPMFTFASFAAHIEELLQVQPTKIKGSDETPAIDPHNVICPICGKPGRSDGRGQCRGCGFLLIPGVIDNPEEIASFKAQMPPEDKNAGA